MLLIIVSPLRGSEQNETRIAFKERLPSIHDSGLEETSLSDLGLICTRFCGAVAAQAGNFKSLYDDCEGCIPRSRSLMSARASKTDPLLLDHACL